MDYVAHGVPEWDLNAGRLTEFAWSIRQAVNARHQQPLQVIGHNQTIQRLPRNPAAVYRRNSPMLDHHADDLFDEIRVPLRFFQDQGTQLFRKSLDRQQVCDQLAGLQVSQSL